MKQRKNDVVRRLVCLSFIATLGCAADEGDPPPLQDGVLDLAPLAGRVELNSWGDGAGWIYADLRERSAPQIWEELGRSEDCVAVKRKEEGTCAQACSGLCTPEGECLDAGDAMSAGDIAITGLSTPTTLVFQDGAYAPDPPPDSSSALYEENATIQVAANGEDFDGFSLAALGVPLLKADPQGANLKAVSESTFTWEAEDSGQIYIEILLGHHLHPPSGAVLCLTADDGSHTVPGTLYADLPDTGFYETHSSYMFRQNSARAETSRGLVELRVRSQVGLGSFFAADE